MYDTIKEAIAGLAVSIAAMIEDEYGECSNELHMSVQDTIEDHINYMIHWEEVLCD